MCVNFLQLFDRNKSNETENLGVLLIGFFEMYGRNFDYFNTGVSLKNGGSHLSKEQIYCERVNKFGNPLLCIEHPLDPNEPVAIYNTRRLLEIKRAFDDAYTFLTTAVSVNQSNINNCKYLSVLCQIVFVPTDVVEYRKWIQGNFGNTLA